MDIVDRKTRSRMMSAVKSKGNRSTEVKMARLLRIHHLSGWRRHAQLPGTPDFVWKRQKVALFVDGCFWHGCSCRNLPKTNVDFWTDKISKNIKHDRKVNLVLREKGWSVIRVWECKVDAPISIRRIQRKLRRQHDISSTDSLKKVTLTFRK